jgi:hypothetical protein
MCNKVSLSSVRHFLKSFPALVGRFAIELIPQDTGPVHAERIRFRRD